MGNIRTTSHGTFSNQTSVGCCWFKYSSGLTPPEASRNYLIRLWRTTPWRFFRTSRSLLTLRWKIEKLHFYCKLSCHAINFDDNILIFLPLFLLDRMMKRQPVTANHVDVRATMMAWHFGGTTKIIKTTSTRFYVGQVSDFILKLLSLHWGKKVWLVELNFSISAEIDNWWINKWNLRFLHPRILL